MTDLKLPRVIDETGNFWFPYTRPPPDLILLCEVCSGQAHFRRGARKSDGTQIRRSHFAHQPAQERQPDNEVAPSCGSTVLHHIARDAMANVLAQGHSVTVRRSRCPRCPPHRASNTRNDFLSAPPGTQVLTEHRDPTRGRIYDVAVVDKTGIALVVEIHRTNAVGADRFADYRDGGFPWCEIATSEILDEETGRPASQFWLRELALRRDQLTGATKLCEECRKRSKGASVERRVLIGAAGTTCDGCVHIVEHGWNRYRCPERNPVNLTQQSCHLWLGAGLLDQ